jgi:hypothetical protein
MSRILADFTAYRVPVFVAFATTRHTATLLGMVKAETEREARLIAEQRWPLPGVEVRLIDILQAADTLERLAQRTWALHLPDDI